MLPKLSYRNGVKLNYVHPPLWFCQKSLTDPSKRDTHMKFTGKSKVRNTIKWGDIEQFSMFFLNKIDYHNHMAPILQT